MNLLAKPVYRIELFGAVRISSDGKSQQRFGLQKAAALLAYLALNPGPQPREQLIELFWPEMDLPSGRNNLSTTMAALRRQLEPPTLRKGSVVLSTHSLLGLNPGAFTTDVAEFERLLDEANLLEGEEQRVEVLERAALTYAGDALPGIYQDWAIREAMRLQVRLLETLDQLAEGQERLGDLSSALRTVQRQITLDPFSERLHIALIRLYVACGHSSPAREAHARFRLLYEDEYGAPVSPETENQVAGLLNKPATPVRATLATPTGRSSKRTLEARIEEQTAANGSNSVAVPIALSRFFGREQELCNIELLIFPPEQTHPTRLVTLTGPGGNGKTRLAVEFAHRASQAPGTWCGFVALADQSDPVQAATTIASALNIELDPSRAPLDQVVSFLRLRGSNHSTCLLILDNIEHLLPVNDEAGVMPGEFTALASRLLTEGPANLVLLCTSRRRVGLTGEQVVPIKPLPIPELSNENYTSYDQLALLADSPSVRLYLDRAQAVRPEFGLTATNAGAVLALVRQLEGSPLAIELAAAWVRVLPPRKMWDMLTQGHGIPAGRTADLPARHRSLTATLDWSYRLLSPAQQRLFVWLSVFPGKWTLEAMECVSGEPSAAALMADLQDASLIGLSPDDHVDDDDRYSFLETVRAFSRALLLQDPEHGALRRRHADYFCSLAEEASLSLRGPDQAQWLSRFEADHENFRGALEYYVVSPDPECIEGGYRLSAALARFWSVRGYWTEASSWFTRVLARDDGRSVSVTLASALNAAATFRKLQGGLDEAKELYTRSLVMRRSLGEPSKTADTLHNLGFLELALANHDAAESYYNEALAIYRDIGDVLGIADELHHLGLVFEGRRDFARAQFLLEESLALRRPLGDLRGIAYTLSKMAELGLELHELERSQTLFQEALTIRRLLGDKIGEATSTYHLAVLLRTQGNREMATKMQRDALNRFTDLADPIGVMDCLHEIATIATDSGGHSQAARLHGAIDAIQETLGANVGQRSGSAADDTTLSLKRQTAKDIVLALLASRSQNGFEQAIQYAVSEPS